MVVERECPDCAGSVEEVSNGWYCSACQHGHDAEEVEYERGFGDLDFPIWVEWESYNDTYGLLDNFCYQTGLEHEDVPIARDMKYTVINVWFKVTRDGVEGAYDEKNGEKL